MYEELYEPLPDVDAYLERIGYSGSRETTVEVLDALLNCQQKHVPFEDLVVFDEGKVPSLGVGDLFDKIVTRHRGGYCFEVNGAFYALLKAMGFDCWSVTGRVRNGQPMPQLPLHRGTLVCFGGERRWVDCGFGGMMAGESVSIDDSSVQHTSTGDFKVVREGGYYTLFGFDRHEQDWIAQVTFSDAPTELADFIVMNFFCAADPKSIFRNMRLVNMRTDTGSIALDGNTFREHVNGVLTKTEISDEEISGILKERFGIVA